LNLAFRGDADDGRPRLPGSLHVNRRLSQWLSFEADGTVTIRPGKVELGQGILTALAQIAAEELDVPLAAIRVAPTVTGESPDEAVTSGSLSIQECGMALRHACADARALCLSVVSQSSGVPPEAIRIAEGRFVGPAGEVGSYAALASRDLLDAEASPDARAKPVAERNTVGRSVPRLDLPAKLFAEGRFLHDLRLPGLLHARMVRPPHPGARLVQAPGFALRDGDFLAAVASSEAEAERLAAKLARAATWQGGSGLPADWPRWLAEAPGERSVVAEHGEERAAAGRVVRRRFLRPFIAHGSVGTCCAVALWDGAVMRVRTHSQGPYNLRTDLAKALGLAPDAVEVQHAEGAGCYGHNGADDVALDAAICARAHPGQPVRALWSRAEELAWAPLSPAMLVEIEATTDVAGQLASWRAEVRGNGHSGRPGRAALPTLLATPSLPGGAAIPASINPPLAGGGGIQRNLVPIYRTPHLCAAMTRLTDMPIRSSALRGLGALANVWAIESVMDELAGDDPVGFRLRHLDDPRASEVLRAATAMAGFTRRLDLPDGEGMGLAVARYKNTGAWCAVVAHVRATERARCLALYVAADLGEVINPDGALNQIEGGALHGVSVALHEEARFDAERILSDSWDSYPVLRFADVPRVQVRLMERPDQPPLGAGEASMPPTIAAIANAIHPALGIRAHRLPFTPENLARETD
jgi:CO/xanthine dehydrogenase Mo-binding subunit